MNSEVKQQLLSQCSSLPDALLGRKATSTDIDRFEVEFGEIPEDFKWILLNCGRILINSDFTDDIDELPVTHHKFLDESELENGWTLTDVFVIGWDGCGNPLGIQRQTGNVVTEDHDFGETVVIAQSIEEIVTHNKGLLPEGRP